MSYWGEKGNNMLNIYLLINYRVAILNTNLILIKK